MAGENMFGKLLTRVQNTRKMARTQAVADLWRRNKLNPNTGGYRLAETDMVQRDGTEITEYRLYKLIDCSVVTVRSEVKHSIETGLGAAIEMKTPNASTNSPKK